MRTALRAAVMLMLLALAAEGQQQEEAGTVVAIEGEVRIHRGPEVFSAKINDPVYPKDVIRTSYTGRIKILFDRSATMTTIAENSDVTITESYYRNKLWKSLFSLGSGRIRLDIEEAFGKDVSVTTPNAIAGAKGTSFIVRYDAREDLSTLLVLRGRVSFGNRASQILVGADQWSTVRGRRAPAAAEAAPAEVKQRETFQVQSKTGKSAGRIPPGAVPLSSTGGKSSLDETRIRKFKGSQKISDNPQVDALTQSGAFIKPGSLVVLPDVKPAPPFPPKPPVPPKPPAPAPPAYPPGGQGGPF